MAAPGRITLRVFTQLDEGLMGGLHLLTQVTHGCTNVIARHQHQAQFVVITKQRRQALIINQCHAANNSSRCHTH
ncbi:hypothetical protein D3C81_2200730 [compost metagenome]